MGAYQGYKIAERKGLTGADRIWTIIGGGLIGGAAGAASGFVGAYVGAGMAAAGIGGFYAGAATGGAAGATAGFINGFGMTTLETGNPLDGLIQGVFQAGVDGLSGALVGGLIQGTVSAIGGNSFWDGSSLCTNDFVYDFTLDPEGGNQTLYRGISGNEHSSKPLFMTDSYEYAAEYAASKGSRVATLEIPKITLAIVR